MIGSFKYWFSMIEVGLSASLAFIMFALGLSLKTRDFRAAISQPKALLAGVLTQIFLLPLVAFVLVLLFGIDGQLAIGIMILSCCPGGVTSNIMTKLAKGDVALSISYTALASVATAFTLPIIMNLSARLLSPETTGNLSILLLSLKVFALATVPVLFGMLSAKWLGSKAQGLEPKLSKFANLLFGLVVLGVLVSQWSVFIGNLQVLGPALLVLNLTMLAIGLVVGSSLGLNTQKTTALAVEAGFQNGTIGIVVGSLIGVSSSTTALTPYSLPSAVYGVLMLLTIPPFIVWRRKLSF